MSHPLSALLAESARFLEQENRSDARRGAREVRKIAGLDVDLKQHSRGPLDQHFSTLVASMTGPMRDALDAGRAYLPWEFSELGGRIRDDVARGMMQVELIGPDGIFHSVSIRLGLWVMEPGLDYPIRNHAAEETFFILAGGAMWQKAGRTDYWAGAGVDIHHPAFLDHATRTGETPLLALWRWSGDISIEQYTLKG